MTAAPDRMIRTLDLGVALFGALLASGAAVLFGFGPVALAVAVGGTVGFANWIAFRMLLWGMIRPGRVRAPRRVVLAVLLMGKILVLVALVYALVAWVELPAAPLAVGYSALVIGLLGGAALAVRPADPQAAGSGLGGGDA